MKLFITYFYKFVAYPLLRIYWFIFRPKTNSVKAVIQYQDQVLFIKNTYYQSKFWFLPGGQAKKNEMPRDTVIREVKEELNLNLKWLKQCGNFDYSREYKKDTIYVFLAKIQNSKFDIDPKEIKKAEWIRIKDFAKSQLSPNTIKCLKLAAII